MSHASAAFLATPAGQVIREQAGILSAPEREFAVRRMPVQRTPAMIHAEYEALAAKVNDYAARGLSTRDIVHMQMNLLDEWEALATGQMYVPQVETDDAPDLTDAEQFEADRLNALDTKRGFWSGK